MSRTHIDEVRAALMGTLNDLRDKDKPMDVDRARAIAQVATVLVDSARVENDYLKITGQDRSQFLEASKDDGDSTSGWTCCAQPVSDRGAPPAAGVGRHETNDLRCGPHDGPA